jgi:ectoine hydroxylase-related dioxygenase (phytanoyl-CoA dioxygenase family)
MAVKYIVSQSFIKDRFHLVLSGYYENVVAMPPKPESTFIEDEIELYSAGDLWWFDNKQMHHVENKSKLPRVAIIFDVLGSYFREKI